MKKILVSTSLIVLGSNIFSTCSIFEKQTKYNSYLVLHRKYKMEQIFNYPSDVHFWSAQDSSTYQMIDTLKYKVKHKELGQ
jgi:hypothetical protein